jgi:hypothetical protein
VTPPFALESDFLAIILLMLQPKSLDESFVMRPCFENETTAIRMKNLEFCLEKAL